ncbi:MAG: amidohydrolase [Anaerolineales bacterium]|nr:amidohydrolase [Anaerolineales bacterium]
MPSLILYNGKIHTQDLKIPGATALAIRDRRILAVGTDADIRNLAGPNTRQIDLGGSLVLPGLSDSHFHYYDWALSRRWLNLTHAASLLDLREQVAHTASKIPPGQWILGRGWNETHWPVPQAPTRADLDGVAPAHPIILWRSDMHLAVVNSQALRKAAITGDTAAPREGVIDHDTSGQPTGVLRELAINLVSDILPAPSEDETIQAMRDGFATLHRLGLSGVHDYRIMGGADGPPAFRAWQRLQAASELAMRVWMNLPGERIDEAVSLGLRTGLGDPYLRIGHLKFFADGSQGARTAWMLEQYEDADYGLPLIPPSELAEAVRRADSAGLSVAIHAIGDRANREVLNIFERLAQSERLSVTAPPAAPHRIEHGQMIQTGDVDRLARLGIVASVQPIHVTDDIHMVDASVGPRARLAYRFRDMLDAGVRLALGSDCPVADPNPLWGIHAAVTRQRRDRTPPGGWYPEQRLTVAEAVWGYTMGAAFVSGREAELGSLTSGKLADIIVLDRDIYTIPPMEIAQAQVAMTIFDGQIVYGD